MDKILAVYEQYKHLDALLSDKTFLVDCSPQRKALYDLWQAIRETATEAPGKKEGV